MKTRNASRNRKEKKHPPDFIGQGGTDQLLMTLERLEQ
jgi:hypothetical protein